MAAFYLQDVTGETRLYTIADISYEAKFREHAAWYLRQKNLKNSKGETIYPLIKPVKIVVED
jgi:hypothetical protein